MDAEQTRAYMTQREAEGSEIASEILLRVVSELGAEKGAELMERLKAARWDLRIDDDRLDAESDVGLTRRKQLSAIARDVERSLGRAPRNATPDELRKVLAPLIRRRPAAGAEPQPSA